MSISETINKRTNTHGAFEANAANSQTIQAAMRATKNWHDLDNDQREALQMIAHKIGRILAGDQNFHDHWHDIAGYAECVANRLKRDA